MVVDGDDAACDCIGATLRAAGYQVILAEDGDEAFFHLADSIPDVIIADLSVPQINGFDFLALVRRRYPQIALAAISNGQQGDAAPSGLNADVFYHKSLHTGAHVLRIVADLVYRSQSVLQWRPCDAIDARAISYVMLTCPGCRRAFPHSLDAGDSEKGHEAACVFCSRPVRYADETPPSIFPKSKVTPAVGSFLKKASRA
jgi:CheY-like chemotaxis protein